ncbi:hypothetical protein E3N88_36033 [Mikania micrantha]|uniref:Uncharacterized protein n=1 Tax=Mikania micrantha TaxID=192012 RepID=A0A5N6M5F0_9ASTR|nr:hypothetical protein E3N88_36033 [Mikania micrantha]
MSGGDFFKDILEICVVVSGEISSDFSDWGLLMTLYEGYEGLCLLLLSGMYLIDLAFKDERSVSNKGVGLGYRRGHTTFIHGDFHCFIYQDYGKLDDNLPSAEIDIQMLLDALHKDRFCIGRVEAMEGCEDQNITHTFTDIPHIILDLSLHMMKKVVAGNRPAPP